jgi:hypothetical protein
MNVFNLAQETEIIVGLIGAVVSIITVILNVLISLRTQRLSRFLEVTSSSLEFKKQQIDELYGPLMALIAQNKNLSRRLKDIKGEDFELLDHLPEVIENPEIGAVVNLLIKNNAEIERLLFEKSSLIEGYDYPSSIVSFLGHCGILKSAIVSQPLKIRRPEDYYPEEFDAYVKHSFRDLKFQVNEILEQRSRKFGRGKR